jgi:hypothetical protein
VTHENHDEDQRTTRAGSSRRSAGTAPSSTAEWRDLLRNDELPEEFAELSRRKRRRAAKHWRSARREEREQHIRDARKKTPTPLAVPAVALLAAVAVAVAALLLPSNDTQDRAKAKASPAAPAEVSPTTPSSPAASPTVTLTDPDQVAKEFVTAYSTRLPLQDGSHAAAVKRAAPYASAPLVDNLKRHSDKDFNRLVAAQATEAKPTKVEITQPTDKQRPAPDTSIRIWRQATVTVAVKGTDPYTYTRHLTVEVARAGLQTPWMVTRVLGIEE